MRDFLIATDYFPKHKLCLGFLRYNGMPERRREHRIFAKSARAAIEIAVRVRMRMENGNKTL